MQLWWREQSFNLAKCGPKISSASSTDVKESNDQTNAESSWGWSWRRPPWIGAHSQFWCSSQHAQQSNVSEPYCQKSHELERIIILETSRANEYYRKIPDGLKQKRDFVLLKAWVFRHVHYGRQSKQIRQAVDIDALRRQHPATEIFCPTVPWRQDLYHWWVSTATTRRRSDANQRHSLAEWVPWNQFEGQYASWEIWHSIGSRSQ